MPNRKFQEWISVLLFSASLISTGLVTAGCLLFLMTHGRENLTVEMLITSQYQISFTHLLYFHELFTPLGLIEIGLLCLVLAQLARVILITCSYLIGKDYTFTVFSSFILITLFYSIFFYR